MILGTAISKNVIPIRLTQERWNHIITSHLEISPKEFKTILEVVEKPDVILKGDTGEFLAIQKIARRKVWVVVAY